MFTLKQSKHSFLVLLNSLWNSHPGSGSDRTTASVRQVTAHAMLYIGRLVACGIDYSFTP